MDSIKAMQRRQISPGLLGISSYARFTILNVYYVAVLREGKFVPSCRTTEVSCKAGESFD